MMIVKNYMMTVLNTRNRFIHGFLILINKNNFQNLVFGLTF